MGLICTNVDRPERTKIFSVGDHNGKFSSCWGYAASVDSNMITNHLPNCRDCRKKLLKKITSSEYACKTCVNKKCSQWNLEANNYCFNAPTAFPLTFDKKRTSPKPPKDRIPGNDKLLTVHITEDWLIDISKFAYHNAKEFIKKVDGKKPKKFWSKEQTLSYLQSCGIIKKQQLLIYEAAKNKTECPIPMVWKRKHCFKRCQYAPMHMLFLGHIKSNISLIRNILKKNKLDTEFSNQCDSLLLKISNLRLRRFNAQQFSSDNGTGAWVSENYLFFARCFKYFYSLPVLRNVSQEKMKVQIACIKRLSNSVTAVLSRLMSKENYIHDLDDHIKLYMDCMVEMDCIASFEKHALSPFHDDNIINKSKQNGTGNDNSFDKKANFVKSNSLGILATAKAHGYFGPAVMYWEGGIEGERKIQEAKPVVTKKRDTNDWKMLSLQSLQLQSCLSCLTDRHIKTKKSEKYKELSHIYKSEKKLDSLIFENDPLFGIQIKKQLYIMCKRRHNNNKLSVLLLEVSLDDKNGFSENGCFFSPIKVGDKKYDRLPNINTLEELADFHVLMLPWVLKKNIHENYYYIISDTWKERLSNGKFSNCLVDINLFKEW